MKVQKYWIQFLCPGAFVGETMNREYPAVPYPRDVVFPDNAYAFRIFMREDVIQDGERYTGKDVQVGPTYYHPDSKVETLEQAMYNPNSTKILIENMKCNGWNEIVWSRWGSWPQPFDRQTELVLRYS